MAALPVSQCTAAIERIHKKEPKEEGGWIYRYGKEILLEKIKLVKKDLHHSSFFFALIEDGFVIVKR